jgi:hypothetical protein
MPVYALQERREAAISPTTISIRRGPRGHLLKRTYLARPGAWLTLIEEFLGFVKLNDFAYPLPRRRSKMGIRRGISDVSQFMHHAGKILGFQLAFIQCRLMTSAAVAAGSIPSFPRREIRPFSLVTT